MLTADEVRPLDVFLVPPGGFGVVIARTMSGECLIRMQNGAVGVVSPGIIAEAKRQLQHLVGQQRGEA